MRLFVVAFLAVAAAISINALYLQDVPRLAGVAVRAENPPAAEAAAGTGVTASLPKADLSAPSAPPSPAAEEPAPKAEPAAPPKPAPPARLVRAIQRELLDMGYAVSEANGVLGLETRTAILAFEFDEAMPLSGEASETVLKALIFGRASGKPGPGAAERFEERRSLVRQVQETLNAMKYRLGPADGRLDIDTRDAIRKFEAERRLQEQGRLTERVLLEMVIVSGRPFEVGG